MHMASDAAVKKRRQQPLQPPLGNLNARKYAESRAAELESLHSVISNRLDNDFRSRRNKRRRTTSFATKNHRRRNNPPNSENDGEATRKVPRRVRRRIELRKNDELGFGVSGDGTKRLKTHVWHAKRFTMTKLWGFYLPLGLHGSGNGSRALLKWCRQGAVVHDSSFYSVVQLKGSQEALCSVMSTVLVGFSVDNSEESSQRILSGDSFGSAMLHHAREEGFKAICPVTYMWRPLYRQKKFGAKDEEKNGNGETESCPNLRQVLIWMHPSASAEGLDCLRVVCQTMTNETGLLVDCVSLDGQLGRIEVMGEGAFQILRKILHPLTLSEQSWTLKKYSMIEGTIGCEVKQSSIFQKEECFSPHTVTSLKVLDPRLLSGKEVAAVPEADLARDLSGFSDVKNKECLGTDQNEKDEVLSTLLSKYESQSSLSNCEDFWDVSKEVRPPMEEHLLCQERHKKSLDFFCLKDTASAKCVSVETFSTFCPILLMRNTYRAGLVTGWSIVLPVSWVKAFWIPLVSRGAHAIGLREKHWISSDVGLPYFPSDFPDCNAYSCFTENEASVVKQRMECRPPAMRPFNVPTVLPWNTKFFTFDKGGGQSTGIESSSNIGANGEFSAHQCSESGGVPQHSDSCEFLVARTCGMLLSFLKEISGDHLLLFPKRLNRDGLSCLMKDETRIRQASDVATIANRGSKLCYLRVCLHAFKEGVFDEGAVVCAPQFSDISLWTSRSDSDESLHVPDALVGSYFKEQPSGKWDIEIPEDTAAREAYRRPIGFVTTGFVRGSKRPSAVGLCEAVLLAQLRLDQWSQTPAKKRRKEIFVLVRNLRSTAYRLALATIVLEGQEDDFESL